MKITPSWRPLLGIAGVAALLGLVAMAALLGSSQLRPASVGQRPTHAPPSVADATDRAPLPTTPPTRDAEAPPWTVPAWVSWLAGLFCLVVAMAAVLGAVWLAVKDRLPIRTGERPPPAREPATSLEAQREAARAAVASGLAVLDDDPDPRRAVIACWVRLEQAAQAAGTAREPADTATDLVTRLLLTQQVSPAVLGQLAELFRVARYTTREVDPAMRERARAALRQLRDELAPR